MEAIRSILQGRRTSLGLSQDAVADRLGCTRGQVGHLELGRSDLTLPRFVAWCRALGLEPADVLRDAGADESSLPVSEPPQDPPDEHPDMLDAVPATPAGAA